MDRTAAVKAARPSGWERHTATSFANFLVYFNIPYFYFLYMIDISLLPVSVSLFVSLFRYLK